MHNLYDTILDPLLTVAFLLAGSAGVQAAKISMLLGGFVLICQTTERLLVGIAGTLLHVAM